MRYRTIPGTDIAVSEVGFGVWTVSTGWWGQTDDAEAIALLRAARARGVTLFDTADTYGSGRGETLLAAKESHLGPTACNALPVNLSRSRHLLA